MLVLETVTQALVYLCFAILMGSFIIYLIPDQYRPGMDVPKDILMLSAAGIAILSFIPVLQLILYLSPGMGFVSTLASILFSFEVGKAWTFTFVVSCLLFIFVIWFDFRQKPLYAYMGIAFTLMLILALSWSSHTGSIDRVWGFLSHSLHFSAVSVWVGILFAVSWFSTNNENWFRFLKWFTPAALVCLGVVSATGLILMSFVMEGTEYLDSWLIPYGQALLIKHLLLLPLVVFALINGLLVKRKMKKDASFQPKPWARMESIIILLIFSVTAALGQQSPPHETIVTNEEVSKLFTSFFQGQFQPNLSVVLTLNPAGILLFVLAIVFIVIMILSFMKRTTAIITFLLGILSVFCLYFALIFSIS
jgi:putative copper resistance protein D